MKKIISMLLILVIALSMAACGETESGDLNAGGAEDTSVSSVNGGSAAGDSGQEAGDSSEGSEVDGTQGAGSGSADSQDEKTGTAGTQMAGSESADSQGENSGAVGSIDADSIADSLKVPTEYPVTLTDQAGRSVTIAEEPQRLVSGYYISTSLLIALDLEEKLVGIEAKADKRNIYRLSAPELIELPNVGSAKEFDLEGCAALEPDLVILPLKLQNAAETLESLGISVLLVNPENQELLTEMVCLIAAATNTQEPARELLEFTSAQEVFLAEALKGEETPSVYLAGNSSMLSTAGDAMYQSDMIRLAGGVNAAGEITDTYWVEISYEQLLAWNPEYIILASDADYSVEDVLADPNLADCEAVVNGNVYQMPDKAEAWDSPVPGGILGAVWLSGVLHPDVADSRDKIIDDYYEMFYGFVYSEN